MSEQPDWSCLRNPKLRNIVEKAYNYVMEQKAKGYQYLGFETGDIGVPFWDFRKLVYDYNIFKVIYHSSRHTDYFFTVPLEEVEKKLKEYSAGHEEVGSGEKLNITLSEPQELFAMIEVYDDYKWLIWKGLKKWIEGGKPAHFILAGSPATAKTMFLEIIEKKIGRTMYIAGEVARRGGFIERVIEGYGKWGKKWILEVDEIDKLDSDALKTIYNLMEGRLDIAVSGKQIRDNDVSIMVIASTNQYWRLPETLRSRFGKPLEFYTYNQEQYIKAVIKALKIENINEDLAKNIADKTASLGIRDVRIARQIARIVDNADEIDRVLKSMGYIK
jgi:hypothetical protein